MGRKRRVTAAATLHVAVAWRLRTDWGATRLLERVAGAAARAEGLRRGQLSIAVVGARAMATLHERHLGVAGPTDVLTFDLGTDPRRGLLDGEIVVCADVARRTAWQRRRLRGSARQAVACAELALYVVHGVLHLAGYDDHDPRDFKRMHAREDELLTALGLGAVYGAGGDGA